MNHLQVISIRAQRPAMAEEFAPPTPKQILGVWVSFLLGKGPFPGDIRW